jgi:two-component system nitrogen regulation response regulator GlnG
VQCTGNILIVDQDSTIVDLLIEILTDAGYVAYAASPSEALAAIVRYPPTLLLLDMWMPGLGGAALIARVREVGAASMPIVVMTTAPYEAAPLLIAEAIEVLAKPFDLDDLLECVARYVQPAQAVVQR